MIGGGEWRRAIQVDALTSVLALYVVYVVHTTLPRKFNIVCGWIQFWPKNGPF